MTLFSAAVYADKPNVVVIITDDQGWADIGYNNPQKACTPNLDRLATEGARLANHYVMPQCTPTRVACFTGRYPGRFGQTPLEATNERCFPVGTPTLANMMKSVGYQTYLIGKWHMGSNPEDGPNHHGFDYSYGSLTGAVGMYDHRYRKGGFYNTWHRNLELIPGAENGKHATDLIAEDAVRVIQEDHDRPFFMMLTFHAPHTPLDERGTFVDRPTQRDPANPKRWLNEDEIKWFNDPDGKIQSETDPEKRLLLAAVHHVDHAIGEVVAALDRAGQRENTLILFSSDNGPQGSWNGNAYPSDLKLTDFNQPLPMRGKKVDVWEGGIHVPGIANWPGRIEPKTVSDQVHIVDWLPTLAGVTGAEPPASLDGIDLAPVLFDDEQLPQREFYWIWKPSVNRRALRYGDWKIVRYGKGEPKRPADWNLYNLSEDPKEENNIAQQHPEVLSQLHDRYIQHRAKDKDAPGTKTGKKRTLSVIDNAFGSVTSPEDQALLLKRLGYDGICTRPANASQEFFAAFEKHDVNVAATYVVLPATSKEVPSQVVEHLSMLRGKGTLVWLGLSGANASDEDAVNVIRMVCDQAKANNLDVVLYPHVGFRTDTIERTEHLRKLADRSNLGISFNLCHFLRQNENAQLEATLRSIAPHLKLVQISGANRVPPGTRDWGELIKPLGEGNFDVGRVIRVLDEIGYQGQVSLQCYQIKQPAKQHLQTSMNTWRRYHSKRPQP
ncbi:sulfatase-like hydrolase/transferase [Rhodopirellula sallentina]|uniref:sulfatase-like hydrolase/transferase n=1 Tax=Rhodopirellula sallentina TaxID=1263869 RepID=UPI001360B0A6|nr:sulfatase-like hydrolase/transferase [Rhodopirellula sallentina]